MEAESSHSEGIRIIALGMLNQLIHEIARSLDDGDARGMSQLYLLREFMGRLENRTGHKARVV
jgi:hypothetical protein